MGHVWGFGSFHQNPLGKYKDLSIQGANFPIGTVSLRIYISGTILSVTTPFNTLRPRQNGHQYAHIFKFIWYFDGLEQDCSHSIANALELLKSCTKPSICCDLIQIKTFSKGSNWHYVRTGVDQMIHLCLHQWWPYSLPHWRVLWPHWIMMYIHRNNPDLLQLFSLTNFYFLS